MDRWDAASMDRDNCQWCGGEYQLTKQDKLRKHLLSGKLCPGSGKPPARRGAGR